MKKEVVALNVIMASKYDEILADIYLYTNEGCIQKLPNRRIEDIEEDYYLLESYKWYFKNEITLKEMLHNSGVSSYYGTEDLGKLNLYIIRNLNYIHTGIGMKKFRKGYMYITDEGELYWCIWSGDRFSAKWIAEKSIKKYHAPDSFYQYEYVVQKDIRLSTNIPIIKNMINEVGEVVIGTYNLTEDNEIVFL